MKFSGPVHLLTSNFCAGVSDQLAQNGLFLKNHLFLQGCVIPFWKP